MCESATAAGTTTRCSLCFVVCALGVCANERKNLHDRRKKNEATQLAGMCIVFAFAFAPVLRHSFIHTYVYVCMHTCMIACALSTTLPAAAAAALPQPPLPPSLSTGSRPVSVSVYSNVGSSWLLLLLLPFCWVACYTSSSFFDFAFATTTTIAHRAFTHTHIFVVVGSYILTYLSWLAIDSGFILLLVLLLSGSVGSLAASERGGGLRA